MIDWQTIESAPRDGRFVLLKGGYIYCDADRPSGVEHGYASMRPVVARWKDGEWVWKYHQYSCTADTCEGPTHWADVT